ncbi:MAG: 50S ribosomal protein L9 [Bacteroidia bacterium]|jgi:large subunit ribosomal protein L9|nr:50S ribosomal protein L9 [Bacteroidota bacterium]MBL7913861.1 50S ribosomal protein L9 [Bacteroidia bacterium]OQA07589.1 MAG: 50S ribosomal protein L9 [Bacteroidetes bacterium ADurb.Bin397]MBK7391420.1 50S ribosomal protein L9 [Bacteroidota bacterium]MBK7967599.1 50S ribosomal protein L9 [Bacteroidota bacterium]
MEIILKQDVKNLGYAHDVVKVRNGYGLNYLIPNGLAVIANESNIKINAEVLRQRSHKLEKLKTEAEKVKTAIENVVLTIPAKVGENGKLFGSVTTQQLADVLKKMGHTIEKRQISMKEEHIKSVGTYTAEVQLHREVTVPVTFEVVAG